jgi:hypothetical protein
MRTGFWRTESAGCRRVGLTEKYDLSLHVLEKLSPCRLNLNYHRKLAAKDSTVKKSLQSDSRPVDMTREHNKLSTKLYELVLNEIFRNSARGLDFHRRTSLFRLTSSRRKSSRTSVQPALQPDLPLQRLQGLQTRHIRKKTL